MVRTLDGCALGVKGRLQHDLAELLPRLHALVGLAQAIEREDEVVDGAQAAGGDLVEGGEEVGLAAHGAADELDLLPEEGPQVDARVMARGGAAGDEAAAEAEA